MNLKQIHNLAKLSYDEFEQKMIEYFTGKQLIVDEKLLLTEKPKKCTNHVFIIGSQKACLYAKQKYGIEYFDEASRKITTCIDDYTKGFIAGFDYGKEVS